MLHRIPNTSNSGRLPVTSFITPSVVGGLRHIPGSVVIYLPSIANACGRDYLRQRYGSSEGICLAFVAMWLSCYLRTVARI